MIQLLCGAIIAFGMFSECSVEQVKSSRYGELPTVATIEARVEWGHITSEQVAKADGFLAVADCRQIGQWRWVRLDNDRWLRMLIFDCAQRDDPHTQEFMKHIPYEMDFYTAEKAKFDWLGSMELVVWNIN